MKDRLSRVWKHIDPKRLKTTLIDMVDIYSPSGKEEDIQLYIESFLKTAGLKVERQVVEEDRYNLLATMGLGVPKVYLVGHVDTVPAWDIETFSACEEEGLLKGLGTADMKGGCAAMLEAWLALMKLPEPERPPVGLLFVVGEEENGDGSALFLETCKPPWVVIGEPTSLTPCFSHYGYLEVALTTRGRRIHSSLPELGHNAIDSMLRFLLLLDGEDMFDRESSNIVYSIREMSSSMAGFVVPDQCDAFIDIHLPPGMSPEIVMATIRACAEKAKKSISELNLEVQFDFSAKGYVLHQPGKILETLEEVYPKLNLSLLDQPFRSHSDGNLFFDAGCSPIILGPGSLETAHTAEEMTSLVEVEAASRIYAAICLAAFDM